MSDKQYQDTVFEFMETATKATPVDGADQLYRIERFDPDTDERRWTPKDAWMVDFEEGVAVVPVEPTDRICDTHDLSNLELSATTCPDGSWSYSLPCVVVDVVRIGVDA